MKKLFKIGLILFSVGLLLGLATYIYVFHKPHRNIGKEKAAYILSANQIYQDFSTQEDSSYVKYGNKVIQVNGQVADIQLQSNQATITMNNTMESVNCIIDSTTMVENIDQIKQISVGDNVELKGQCDGYDMITGVVITRCILL
jgi:hypothetical protein